MNTNLELINDQSASDNQNRNHLSDHGGFNMVVLPNYGGRSSSFSDHHHHQQQQQSHHLHHQYPINLTDHNNNSNSIQSFSDSVENLVNLFPPPVSSNGLAPNNKSLVGRKRKRNNGRKLEKPEEVIHVRAKRGQATDSHSLAERVRREKINERLRCLQNLVPGCYKTMGMAVMLDVIINYVRSLQNQIEFLSMKLSAASMYYDFNSEPDPAETMQGTNAYEVQEMEKILREGYGGPSHFHSTWSA